MKKFKSVLDVVKTFPDDESCDKYLESILWPNGPVSPFDPESKVYTCKNGRYKCKNTGKYFNVRIGTIFDHSQIDLQTWFVAIYLFSIHGPGISSRNMAKYTGTTPKTGWYLTHRLRKAFKHPEFSRIMTGGIEIDETLFGGKDTNRHEHKKKGQENNWGKDMVFGMKERGNPGTVLAFHVPDSKAETLMPIIKAQAHWSATFFSDENPSYSSLSNDHHHYTVIHSANEYVNGKAHTNGIENFWSFVKRGVDGSYYWVSTKHLQAYLDEYAFRRNTRKETIEGRFNKALSNIVGILRYKDLIKH